MPSKHELLLSKETEDNGGGKPPLSCNRVKVAIGNENIESSDDHTHRAIYV